ncbi:MAG: 4Fe-4S dicluster domain-containing protein [Gemmatimonadaceae bacterium]|nr:4Fe-4S dicluster domain-containing protein [Gemmatimonadaceae bacterium]
MADTPLGRRGFFSQGLSRLLGEVVDAVSDRVSPGTFIRPPGAIAEAAFLAACTRCKECAVVCPALAIRMLPSQHGIATGTPVLEVDDRACLMCADMPCVTACPTGALLAPTRGWRDVKMAVIGVDDRRCLAFQGIECGVCARVCPVGDAAIHVDAQTRPFIGADCTGCGKCVTACVTTPSAMTARPLRN